MKKLLVAVNAKFIHTNLAIHTLYETLRIQDDQIEMVEYTINHSFDQIVKDIYLKQPEIIGFSCYIWNISLISKIIGTLKKIMPEVIIIVGGPEVAYQSKEVLESGKAIDYVVTGEGEWILPRLFEAFEQRGDLTQVEGITYRSADQIVEQQCLHTIPMDNIPFPYEDLGAYPHRILYYESSRGCPFRCAYCLSSLEKSVRFKSLEVTFKDLKKFIDYGVRQVKFIDRTFNMDIQRAKAMWRFLIENDNQMTNFHFEVSGDLFDQESLELIGTARPGLFQFEMGIQSTNDVTNRIIKRVNHWDKIEYAVQTLVAFHNSHLHLDLIAGLPGENYTSFKRSFNQVYALGAEQLQLGFLKVLKGSDMETMAKEYGIQYKEETPYEVLSTNDLNYGELLRLKDIETILEIYGNSGHFEYSLKYCLLFFETPFDFYEQFALWFEQKQLFKVQHQMAHYFTLFYQFMSTVVQEMGQCVALLKLDWLRLEKPRKYPEFLSEQEAYKSLKLEFYKEPLKINQYLPSYSHYDSKQIARMTHLEVFEWDVLRDLEPVQTLVIIDYQQKSPLSNRPLPIRVEI